MDFKIPAIADAEAISRLIISSVFPHYSQDFSEEGWRRFISFNSPEAISKKIVDIHYFTLCAFVGDTLVGVIRFYEREKLDQLFIAKDYWRQGVATQLWEKALTIHFANHIVNRLWLRSSTMAIPLYESLGFVKIGDRQEIEGIAFQMMEYNKKEIARK